MALEIWVQSQVKSYQRQKMVVDASLLNNATVLVAKVVLPPLAPPATFATGQGMKTERKFLFVASVHNGIKGICFHLLMTCSSKSLLTILHIMRTFHLPTLGCSVRFLFSSIWSFSVFFIHLLGQNTQSKHHI